MQIEASDSFLTALSPPENMMRLVHQEFDGDGIACTFYRLEGDVDPAAVRGALRMMARRHPKLRARILVDEKGQAFFRPMEGAFEPPLLVTDHVGTPLPWQREMLEAIGERFDADSGPLWRVRLLRDTAGQTAYLFWAIHHSIFDGAAVTTLISDFLGYYDKASDDLAAGTDSIESIAALPLIEPSPPKVTSPLGTRARMAYRIVTGFLRRRRVRWTMLPPDRDHSGPFWEHKAFSEEETRALLERAKEEGAGTYGLYLAAALHSLLRCLGVEQARFSCKSPLDVRRFQERRISREHLGFFASRFEKIYTVTAPLDFWTFAARSEDEVREFASGQGPQLALRFARFLKIHRGLRLRRDTLTVDNISKIHVRTKSRSLRLSEIGGSVRNFRLGSSLFLAAFILEGRLNLSFGAADVDKAFFEALWRTLQETLVDAMNSRP